MKPYALVADVHAHNWSQFSQIDDDGINTRLAAILSELKRCAVALQKAGGTTMRVAGDLFHVRGTIAPSVFNPTFETFKEIAELGVDIEIIPGNHDLEGKNAEALGNAMQQLLLIDGCHVVIKPEATDDGQCVMIPWIEDLDDLRATCIKHADPLRDLIIHAPLNGVIKGLPDTGLDPAECAAWGYRRVFVGHYHNHKDFGGVYSVGATTHQTWSDPDSVAGFCLVYPDRVEHNPTQAPRFVNIDPTTAIDKDLVEGNYLRLRLKDVEQERIVEMRAELTKLGAAGMVDHSTKKREVTRGGVSAPSNVALEVSVANYVAKHHESGKLSKKQIAVEALDVLREARTLGNE